MSESTENQSEQPSGPTWQDFKPPVVTTPYTSPPAPIPPVVPSPPLVAPEPVNLAPVVPLTIVPQPVPNPAPATPVTPPVPSAAPPIADTVTLPYPEVSAPVTEEITPAPVAMPVVEVAPAGPADPMDSMAPVEGYLAPQPVSAPVQPQVVTSAPVAITAPAAATIATTAGSGGGMGRLLPWILGLLLIAATAVAGYFFWTQRPTGENLGVSTSTPSEEEKAILAQAVGPDSWENNYSTPLLASEKGGLEFLITDPESVQLAQTATDSAAIGSAATLQSLKIVVAKVEVKLTTQSVEATGTAPEATQSASKLVDRWETLRLNQNNVIDLMALRQKDGLVQSLGVTYLAAGRYSEIRVYITKVSGVTASGEAFVARVSPENGVIGLVKSFDVTTTGTVKLTIDIDATRSVLGSGGDYLFSPVVIRTLLNSREI